MVSPHSGDYDGGVVGAGSIEARVVGRVDGGKRHGGDISFDEVARATTEDAGDGHGRMRRPRRATFD